MNSEVTELISKILKIKKANQFLNFIDYIQFPFFRNIELNQRINFEFPLTIFVGPNGSGKSSTLHALYGSPEGFTPYDFWFSTSLDPIEYYSNDGRKLRHSFFYGYKNDNGDELQVIKARIKRKDNPDYWETSRPLVSAGMIELPDGKRNPPIKKDVIYFDFRSELSAFDKYFYFETPPLSLVSRTPQDYLRHQSRMLKSIFTGRRSKITTRGVDQNKQVEELKQVEKDAISEILGKKYEEVKIISHKLFHNWGYSIRVKTDFHKYSEAFAGSGEIAVIRLVHALLKAEEYSLILLDEPEVSLHPGAQKRLKIFLLEQIKKRKHQLIISTHSPTLIEELPKESIKVFSQKLDTGRFIIKENIFPDEAFYFIGQKIGEKTNIFVEDKLSKKILDAVLKKLGPEVINRFDVRFIPGGASILQQNISVYCNSDIQNTFFIFDGDQKKVDDFFDVTSLSDSNKNVGFLKNKIIEQTGVDVKFYPDGNMEGGNEEQLIEMMISFLSYYKEHVFYIPKQTPENIIWSEEEIKKILDQSEYENNIERIRGMKTAKDKIYESAKLVFGNEQQVMALEDRLIKKWLEKDDENSENIKRIILRIEEIVET